MAEEGDNWIDLLSQVDKEEAQDGPKFSLQGAKRGREVEEEDGEKENLFTKLKKRLAAGGEEASKQSKEAKQTSNLNEKLVETERSIPQPKVHYERLPSLEHPKPSRSNAYAKPPKKSAYFAAKKIDGTPLYFPYDKFASYKKPGEVKRQLLSKSIYRLMDDVESEKLSMEASLKNDILECRLATPRNDELEGQLWLEKYRPKNFSDLTSDHWVMEQILLWVRQWDKCVFNKEPTEKLKSLMKPTADYLGRPNRKILLIHGPPGLGKTSLAHVIATQAGYNVMELNASDERGSRVLKERVVNAIESKAVFGNKKPTCVILDEMDGIGQGGEAFVNMLCKLATVTDKPPPALPGKKKRKNPKTLKRPIICLCNDAYVPVLRPLRSIAQVYSIKGPDDKLMYDRLKQICNLEGVNIQPKALSFLSQQSEGDWRVCLNTLQLLSGKQKREEALEGKAGSCKITFETMQGAIGYKDKTRNMFELWATLFKNQEDSSLRETLEKSGDQEKLIQGAFEMYLNAHIRDFQGWGSNYLALSEYLNLWDNVRTNYGLQPQYAPWVLFAFKTFTRHVGNFKPFEVTYPRQDSDNWKETKELTDVGLSFLQKQDLDTLHWLGNLRELAAEYLSFILRIFSPTFSNTNPHIMKDGEKLRLTRVAEVMAHFGVSYRQEKSEDGRYTYKLEPPIHLLASFGGESPLPKEYAIKQTLAFEVDQLLLTSKRKLTSEPFDMKPKLAIKKKAPKRVVKDFFGRPLKPQTQIESIKKRAEIKKPAVVFKYHEGYSNAVRRQLKISDIKNGKSLNVLPSQ